MYAKNCLTWLVPLALAFSASAQLVRPGLPLPNQAAPAGTTIAAPGGKASAPAVPPGAVSPAASNAPATPAPAPAAPVPAASVGSAEAQETIRTAAARARAQIDAEKAISVPAIKVVRDGQAPLLALGASADPKVREPAEPRLLSIVGTSGRERAELSHEGLVYSVSRDSPRLGNTGWRLVAIDVVASSVRVERTDVPSSDRASAGTGRKTAKAAPASKGITIGFSRRDTEFPAASTVGLVR